MLPLEILLRKIMDHKTQYGELTTTDVLDLARIDRLRQVLVRCGSCRFTCAAQDVNHLLGIISREGTDYVRNVSLLAYDPAYTGDYRPVTQDWIKPTPVPIPAPATPPLHHKQGSGYYEPEWRGDHDPGL